MIQILNGISLTRRLLIPIGADLLDLRMAQPQWIWQFQVIINRFDWIFGHHNLMMGNLRKWISGFHGIDGILEFSFGGNVAIVAGLFHAIDGLQAFVGIVENLFCCVNWIKVEHIFLEVLINEGKECLLVDFAVRVEFHRELQCLLFASDSGLVDQFRRPYPESCHRHGAGPARDRFAFSVWT